MLSRSSTSPKNPSAKTPLLNRGPPSQRELRPGSRRIEPVEIPVKLVFYLLDSVEFYFSLGDLSISIALFQHRNGGSLQLLLLRFYIARKISRILSASGVFGTRSRDSSNIGGGV